MIPGLVSERNPTPNGKHIIIDLYCGISVIRGADIFAPGVMGSPRGIYTPIMISFLIRIIDQM